MVTPRSCLEAIELRFPAAHAAFTDRALSLLQPALVRARPFVWSVAGGREGHRPELHLSASCPQQDASAVFHASDRPAIEVAIINATGEQRASPERYRPIALPEIERRVRESGLRFTRVDHLGFNLPWFGAGVHPRIVQLRRVLAPRCLYHRFPTGEPWDFILPGTPAEIASTTLDYGVLRRPKFELVSFDRCSRPIVQIDLGCDRGLEELVALFPEALADPAVGNAWVYVEGSLELDLCLVIGPHHEGDWSGRFRGCRMT